MKLRIEPHAAHYQGGGGHDLEWMDLEETVKPTKFNAIKEGKQFWHFCRKAPLSQGKCGRCP